MRKFSKMLAFALAAAMVFTAFAPAAKADAAEKAMAINKQGKILYLTDGTGINDAGAEGVEEGKGNVSEYDFAVSNKPADYKEKYTFQWFSSDPDVITVGKAGLTKAVGVGTADVMCLVTDKATGDYELLKNTITVKANADKVAIKAVKVNGTEVAAEDLEGLTVEVGAVVDLDREMTDAAGNKTTKRGEFVTDYTRWVVTDADGKDASDVVTVDAKKGQFTFTEKAAAGKYFLYCETYQSSKYPKATAESEKIAVEFKKDLTFTVDQKTPDSFVLTFGTKLAAAPDVKVTNVISEEFRLNEYVKDVKLADNGIDVTVTMFNALGNGFKYAIEVPGCEAGELIASASEPVAMEIFVEGKDVPTAVVETDTKVGFKLYDIKGVDVTSVYKDKGTILFDAEYSADYQLSYDGTLYFYEANKIAEVTAEFKLDGQDANGNDYVALPKKTLKVVSVAKATVSIDKLSEVKIGGKDAKIVTMLANADGVAEYAGKTDITFKVTLKSSDNAKVDPIAFTGGVGAAVGTYGNLYVQVADNSVLDVDPDNLTIIPYRAGSTNIYFKVGKDADSARIIDYITVQVRDVATFSTLKPATSDVEVATVGVATTAELAYSAFTQYTGEAYEFTAAEIAGATFAAKSDKDKYVDGLFTTDGKKITVNGNLIDVPEGSTSARYTYTFKIANKSFDFRVTFKTTLDDSKDRVELVLTSGAFGDISRSKTSDDKDKAEAEKLATFTAYVINNSVKKTYVDLDKYVADAASGSAYYVNVLKDGKPVTKEAYVVVDGSTVTIKFNGVDNGNVSYPAGTGNFVVELYKGTDDGKGTRVYRSASFSTTKTDKKYNLGKQVKDNVAPGYTDDDLKACFEFTNTENKAIQGNNAAAVDKFEVKTITSGNSVHVVSFTFYDKVSSAEEADVFVPYTVNVGKTLVVK